MDETAFAAARAELRDWGVLEPGDGAPAVTRRFRGAIMRAAMRLQEEEKAGRAPDGHPVVRAVADALRAWPLPDGATATPAHERLVAAVELASLPEAVLALLERSRP